MDKISMEKGRNPDPIIRKNQSLFCKKMKYTNLYMSIAYQYGYEWYTLGRKEAPMTTK